MRTKKLGISTYPFKHSFEQNKKYLNLAKKYGFSRMFTSLLEIDDKTKEKNLELMKELCSYAKELGYEVILDVSPRIFDKLNIKLPNLIFFHEMKVALSTWIQDLLNC